MTSATGFRLMWFVVGLNIVGQTGCGGCLVNVTSNVSSPDRASRALVYVRNCGATTWFTTEVSILRADEPVPRGHGNVATIDDNNGSIPIADSRGAIAVRVMWLSLGSWRWPTRPPP
jgi:hypothetical protein